jgi:hypothetical protein
VDKRNRAALQKHYEALPRDQLQAEGRAHLGNDVRQKARTSLRYGWIIVWTLIVGALVVIGVFSVWMLFMAKESGKSFGDMRKQAMSAYTEDPP